MLLMRANKLRLLLLGSLLTVAATQLQGCAPVLVAGTVASAGVTIASDRRDASKMLADQAIEIKATDRIYADKVLGKVVRINVNAFNGMVLITGEAPSMEMRDRIHEIARQVEGVRELYNEVQVKDPISLNDRTHDYWISSKVKARLISRRGLFTGTKVIASDGTVYLMGLATPREFEEASEIAAEVGGTQSVIALFETVDSNSKTRRLVKRTTSDAPLVVQQEEMDLMVVPRQDSQPPPPMQSKSE